MSPIFTPFASGPNATTSPTFSWPMVSGSLMPRSASISRLAAANIVIAFPDVQVGMAHAGREHLQQHLRARRLRGRPARSPAAARRIGRPDSCACHAFHPDCCHPVLAKRRPVHSCGVSCYLDALRESSPRMTDCSDCHHHHTRRRGRTWSRGHRPTGLRSSERSSAASTRRLTKSYAADWRSRGRGRSIAISVEYPARLRPHHHDAVGEHDRLVDVVGDHHQRRASGRPTDRADDPADRRG